MRKTGFILRNMKLIDIESGLRLSNAEGWNQTEKDWELLIENAGNVCMVAEWNNKVIGTTTAINYSNDVAWIGMVLVDKEHRGQGVSKALLTNIFKELRGCRSIKLDATPEGQRVYKKLDFKEEYTITRMVNPSVKHVPNPEGDALVQPVQANDVPEIISLDEFIFDANRTQLIKYLVNEYPEKAWLVKRNDQLTGFALGRDGNKYHQIGPVIASTTDDAKILISKALNKLIGRPTVVDVLHDKEDLVNWFTSMRFIKQRQFVRMYKKENRSPGIAGKQYLISGPEFG